MKCVKNEEGKITGFLGVADPNLEMLFIHPYYRGKQIGKTLLNYSIEKMNVKKMDVNEQNEQAVGFYKKVGLKQKVVRNWIHRENHTPLYI
ncbi:MULTISPECIES: GNAT family N-acetyltransferase [Flavobacterium]|uniref:GNAT family N-acetyltransferase n=1 Tax=Flavobacterium TaxID=237 RepID=UPI0027DA1418|nr:MULTISPECIES: GNAT family N-acetyltransferase [Flavobacterium]